MLFGDAKAFVTEILKELPAKVGGVNVTSARAPLTKARIATLTLPAFK